MFHAERRGASISCSWLTRATLVKSACLTSFFYNLNNNTMKIQNAPSTLGNYDAITMLLQRLTNQFQYYAIFLSLTLLSLSSCKKEGVPELATSTVSNITQVTSTSGGTITNEGSDAVLSRGICWNSSPEPTTSNNKTSDGVGAGSFISNLSGLTPGTTYYVRAYATNTSGTGYGNQISFSTQPVMIATLTTSVIGSITSVGAASGGNISSDGGGNITARGVCWNTSSGPTINNNKTSDGNGTGSFTSIITNLNGNTTYYVRAYATNSAGTAYGNEQTFTTWPSVSLSTAIQPIFTAKCTGCHKGTRNPDLREGYSCASLTTGGYVTIPAASSRLYTALTSVSHSSMTTQEDKNNILAWIAGGALNNK